MKLALVFLAAAAVGFGCTAGLPVSNGNTIQSAASCAEVDTIVNTPVTQRLDTYATELRARIGNGAFLYDQTFAVAFSDTTVQNAITTARGVLSGAGAVNFTGPTQLSSNVSQVSSNTVTVVNNTVTTNTLVGTASYVGPFSPSVGALGICTGYIANPPLSGSGSGLITAPAGYVIPTGCVPGGTSYPIVSGGILFDTLTTALVTVNQTATTTNTFRTTQLYELDGFAAGVPVTPAPPALLLTLTALLCVGLFLLCSAGV